MRTLGPRLHDFIFYTPPDPVELLSGLLSIGWGLWLSTHDTLNQYPSLYGMRDILGRPGWILVFVVGGSLQAYSLLYGRLALRRFCALWAFLTWVFVTILIVEADPNAVGGIVYSLFSLFAGWAAFLLSPRKPPQI